MHSENSCHHWYDIRRCLWKGLEFYNDTAAGNARYFYLKSIVGRGRSRIWCVSYDSYVVISSGIYLCCRRVVCVHNNILPDQMRSPGALLQLYCCTSLLMSMLMSMLHRAKRSNQPNVQRVILLLSHVRVLAKPGKIWRWFRFPNSIFTAFFFCLEGN